MNHLGIEVNPKNMPLLDAEFIPVGLWMEAYLKGAAHPFKIAIERENGKTAVLATRIYNNEQFAAADSYYAGLLAKILLWQKGGFRLHVAGSKLLYQTLSEAYRLGGARDFDVDFWSHVYGRDFEVIWHEAGDFPTDSDQAVRIGRDLSGCRIGFDAGGSDRKVSALIDGEIVFSEEKVWFPKENSDPSYQFDGIVDSLRRAAEHLPRVDGIGVSSAGVIVDGRPKVSSLFIKVPKEVQASDEVELIFFRAAKEIGDVPVVVANDGDVSALAGGYSFGMKSLLGVSMGTSVAVGYLNDDGDITGWQNELAFAPVDVNPAAMADEWSGDIGCACKYFSQDAVIKLAPAAGIALSDELSLADKLVEVQRLAEEGHQGARDIFSSIGVYFGHTAALYYQMYGCQHILLLGRVMSGIGGELIVEQTKAVLADEYPAINLELVLPDERFRRLGQSTAAALLPDVKL